MVVTLLSMALLAFAPAAVGAGAGTANAAENATAASTDNTTQVAPTRLKARRITEKIVKTPRGRLIFRGQVSRGKYKNRVVIVQRKHCNSRGKRCGKWGYAGKVRTNKRAIYKKRVGAPRTGRWYYRAKVTRGNGYRTSFSAGRWYTLRY